MLLQHITSIVTSFTAPGDDVKLATTKAIVDYIGTNPPGAESLAATLAVGNTTGGTDIAVSAGDDITFTSSSKILMNTTYLQIYNNGNDSWIQHTHDNTGSLYILGDSIKLKCAGK